MLLQKKFYKTENFSFYMLPKVLFSDENADNGLSVHASAVYAFLYDRGLLSARNGWKDVHKKTYILFSVKELMFLTGYCKNTVIKILKELSRCGLIEKKQLLTGHLNHIYVKEFPFKEEDSHAFYKLPKILFCSEHYRSLSCDAKILYGMMVDRLSLSKRNDWKDGDGKAYVLFSVENIMRSIHCKKNKTIKLLRELEEFGLIEKKAFGSGRKNLFYINNPLADLAQKEDAYDDEIMAQTYKNERKLAENAFFGTCGVQKNNPNNTDIDPYGVRNLEKGKRPNNTVNIYTKGLLALRKINIIIRINGDRVEHIDSG